MKIQPRNVVITVCVIVITPFVWTLLFSNNGMQSSHNRNLCLSASGVFDLLAI